MEGELIDVTFFFFWYGNSVSAGQVKEQNIF